MSGFENFRKQVNLMLVIDHAGRAGNGFFQTIFDTHPDVIVCPWIHYVYSYIIQKFGDKETLNCNELLNFWPTTVYFSLIYGRLDESKADLITKMGGNPKACIDRLKVKSAFDQKLMNSKTISRHDFICLIFYSFAIGIQKDLNDIKFILCTDSISLKHETLQTGYSGKVIDAALLDFPEAKLIHLERDPRAGFASSNHQFINQLGNMYGLSYSNFWSRLKLIHKRQLNWDSFFVFGFWMLYFRETYQAIMLKKESYPNNFLTVFNEELNLNFAKTMTQVSEKLGIQFLNCWDMDFEPTMLGVSWTGTGAYNNQYQRNHYGPLKNDPDIVAGNVRGPNSYVTRRWRNRLMKHEILLLEYIFVHEIEHFGYEFVNPLKNRKNYVQFRAALWRPLNGELPTLFWIRNGLNLGIKEFLNRIFYLFVFPIFYVYVRVVFLKMVREKEF